MIEAPAEVIGVIEGAPEAGLISSDTPAEVIVISNSSLELKNVHLLKFYI